MLSTKQLSFQTHLNLKRVLFWYGESRATENFFPFSIEAVPPKFQDVEAVVSVAIPDFATRASTLIAPDTTMTALNKSFIFCTNKTALKQIRLDCRRENLAASTKRRCKFGKEEYQQG